MVLLKATKVYTLLRQSAHKIVGYYFLVVYLPDNCLSCSMAGITVSSKVGKAVNRNKIKRRIKSVLRSSNLADPEEKFMCNIIALKTSAEADYSALRNDLEFCLRKIHLKLASSIQRME